MNAPEKLYKDVLRNDFFAFLQRSFWELNPVTAFEDAPYLELLASALEDVRLGRCKRLIVNLPPRLLKSITASVAFVAWLLGHDPAKKILAVSYSQDLSDKLARDCRSIMTSPFYRALFETRLSEERNSVAEYETNEGGYRLSSSIAGGITGRGADIVIIDDPMKADEALSDARRASLKTWFDNTLRSRLNRQAEGAIILVMQRLHTDDLVAHVQEREDWRIISLSAIAEKGEIYLFETPYGTRTFRREAGDLLHPILLPQETLDRLRQGMTEYNFAAQYQQDPQPPEGNIVRRSSLLFYEPNKSPNFEQIVQSWDTANKATDLADYSVCTTWGVWRDHMYLLDVYRKKLEFPALKRAVTELAGLHRADVVLIEDKASGTQLIQQLRAEGFWKAKPAPQDNSEKIMRLHAQTAKIEGGFVHFPKSATWLDAFIAELTGFPNSKNDDQVDSMVNALTWQTEMQNMPGMGFMLFWEEELARERGEIPPQMFRVEMPSTNRCFIHYTMKGRKIEVGADGIIEVTQEELRWFIGNGGRILG